MLFIMFIIAAANASHKNFDYKHCMFFVFFIYLLQKQLVFKILFLPPTDDIEKGCKTCHLITPIILESCT